MKNKISNSFSKRASSYDSQSFVQEDVNKRLLSRLNIIKHNIVDSLEIGSGTGCLSENLKQNYPNINLTSMDLSHEMSMIHISKNSNARCIIAKAEDPPFKEETFDTILSSLTLHWCEIDTTLFGKYHNLLKPNGLLLFSVAGPDTFKEFRKCPKEIYHKLRFNTFLDMHHYGDYLLNSNFKDPVVDNEQITLEFSTFEKLLKSLRLTGTNIISTNSNQSISKTEYKIIKSSLYNQKRKAYELTYEIIFGYALKHPKTLDKTSKLIEIKELKKD